MLKRSKLPVERESKPIEHVAIIMDGNGRWAKERSHRRVWGHIRGANVVSEIVEEAIACGVKYLTLYAFSTENWSRPFEEIHVLFALFKKFILREENKFLKNQVKFNTIGDLEGMPKDMVDLISSMKKKTREFDKLVLTIAFNYGAQSEIIHAINKYIKENPGKQLNQKDLSDNLMAPECGDVDLLIRTGGDQRISNFLLWQIAYAELCFVKTKWPDFSREEFREIVKKISKRERRFGFISSRGGLDDSMVLAFQNKQKVIREEGFR